MPTEKQRSAFISYSRVNKEFASELAKRLRSAGYPIWFDLLDIPTGSRWDGEVEKALRECPIFMIILTPASIASENVKDEIGYAIDHGKNILPVLLENCDVPLRLRRFQYVDFTSKSFEQGFESSKALLGNFVVDESLEPIITKTYNQKKSESKRLIIGIFIALLLVGIGFGASSKRLGVGAFFVNPATQTPITGLTVLSAKEAAQFLDAKGFSAFASEIYSEDQLNQFVSKGQPIPLTINNPDPLKLAYAGCAKTQEILESNLASYVITFSIDGEIIPGDSINYYDSISDDGLPCRTTYVVFKNWVSGIYKIRQQVELVEKIDDGYKNIDPYFDYKEFNVTVP